MKIVVRLDLTNPRNKMGGFIIRDYSSSWFRGFQKYSFPDPGWRIRQEVALGKGHLEELSIAGTTGEIQAYEKSARKDGYCTGDSRLIAHFFPQVTE
jgi:hypothetical protein